MDEEESHVYTIIEFIIAGSAILAENKMGNENSS
jgi:hypothetical protein